MELEMTVQSAYEKLFYTDEFKPMAYTSIYHSLCISTNFISVISVAITPLLTITPVIVITKYLIDRFLIESSNLERNKLYTNMLKILEPISCIIENIRFIMNNENLRENIHIDSSMFNSLETYFKSVKNRIMIRLSNKQIRHIYYTINKILIFDKEMNKNSDFNYIINLVKSEHYKRNRGFTGKLTKNTAGYQIDPNFGIYRFFDSWIPGMEEKRLLKIITDLTLININLTLINNNINLQLFALIADKSLNFSNIFSKLTNSNTYHKLIKKNKKLNITKEKKNSNTVRPSEIVESKNNNNLKSNNNNLRSLENIYNESLT